MKTLLCEISNYRIFLYYARNKPCTFEPKMVKTPLLNETTGQNFTFTDLKKVVFAMVINYHKLFLTTDKKFCL